MRLNPPHSQVTTDELLAALTSTSCSQAWRIRLTVA
jgi:hypothetical protein